MNNILYYSKKKYIPDAYINKLIEMITQFIIIVNRILYKLSIRKNRDNKFILLSRIASNMNRRIIIVLFEIK